MKRSTTRCFLVGAILLSLSVVRVGCFFVCGADRLSGAAHQLRPPSRYADRLLQQTQHPQSREAGDSLVGGFGGKRGLVQRASSRRTSCGLRQGVRLFASAGGEQQEDAGANNVGAAETITEELVEQNYTPEEREFVAGFLAEYEAAEEPQPDEDDLAVYSNDYKMYSEGAGAGAGDDSLSIEWDAAMGKKDYWELAPFEEFDPKVPPVHYKYHEDDLQANLTSEINPFPLHSEWVDRDIKVGDIDEAKREAIEPMMPVIEQVCTLIDTTDDVFSFKYVGPIRHKKGIASWAMVLIKRLYPEVKGVEFVTNRTRDRTDW